MKKLSKIIMYSFMLFFGINGYSQCVVNTTTTDWNKFNGGSGPSNNDFNWATPGLVYPLYLQDNLDNPSRNIELPYFCTMPGGSGSCGNKNTLAYELLGNIAALQDIKPEDGWELVLKNFGTQNTTPNDNTGRGVSNPFFVLYNKHTGRLKTFLAVVGVRSGSSALIRVEFEQGSKHTALFSHAEPIIKAVKKFDNTLEFNTINEIAQQNFVDDYYWLVSEIQTAYDPCACHHQVGNTLPSVIVVTPIIIQSSKIEATVEGTLEQVLVDASGNVSAETSGKTSFKELGNAALKGYNSWNAYKTKAHTFFDKSNKTYKDKLVKDWWKEYKSEHPAPTTIDDATKRQAEFTKFKSTDENFKKLMGISDIDKYDKTVSTLKGVASLLPYVGAAIGVIDLLSKGGEVKTSSTPPSPPMVFSNSLTLSGTITSEQKLPDFAFHNPGTISSSSPTGNHLEPIYNNVLGVFNILREPSFEHFYIESNAIVKFYDKTFSGNDPIELSNIPRVNITRPDLWPIKQYRIREDVKYAINPASNLAIEVIDAAYVLEYDGTDDLFLDKPGRYDSIKAIPFYNGIYQGPSIITMDERIELLDKSGFHLERVSADYPTGATSTIRFSTGYVPLTCINKLNFILFGGGGLPKVYLKLLIKMKRTDNADAEGVTQVITYDVSNKFSTSPRRRLPIKYTTFLWEHIWPTGAPPRHPYYLFNKFANFNVSNLPLKNPYYKFSDITYLPSMGNIKATGKVIIPSGITIPSNTTISSFGEIIVGQNVTFGNNVKLISAEKIDLPPNNTLNPTVELIINPLLRLESFNCTSSEVASLKASQVDVDAICNSNKYVQNSGQNKNDPYQYQQQKEEASITECNIYPNPAVSNVYVNLKLEKEMEYVLLITDIQGKTLLQVRKKGRQGKNNTSIDVSSLAPGVYFIQVKGNHYKKTDKLIIVR